MSGRERVATRSSARLTNKSKDNNHYNKEEQFEQEEYTAFVSASTTLISTTSNSTSTSTSVQVSERTLEKPDSATRISRPQSSLSNISTASTASVGNTTTVRTTTSRRGGRLGRSVVKRNQSQPAPETNSFEDKTTKKEMVESGPVIAPSTAAAAAAAAAKALCDNPNRSMYSNGDLFRGYHDDRQNVFRRQPIQNTDVRITTRSKNGIQKPKAPFGSTVRVMGSPTATHIPRLVHGAGSGGTGTGTYERQRSDLTGSFHSPAKSNTPASVFRDRRPSPGPEAARPFDDIEASPQELLLSLKSGSRSFDMQSPRMQSPRATQASSSFSRNRDETQDGQYPQATGPLSPEAPPRIQHSHHQAMKADSFFFDPRTPKTPKTPMTPNVNFNRNSEGLGLHGTPSFSLFNQSFDSFGDAGYLRSPNVGAPMIDPGLHRSFSLAASVDGEEASPRKKSLMASPGSLSFLKQKHDDFADDSPGGISLDNVINDAINAPLMPRTPSQNETDTLIGNNVMILESSNTVRRIPTPTFSNKSPMNPNPMRKARRGPAIQQSPVRLEHRPAHPYRAALHNGPLVGPDPRMMRGAPPPLRQIQSPPRVHPVVRHPMSCPPVHSAPRSAPVPSHPSYRRNLPPQIYRGGRPNATYRPEKKDTSLVGLDAAKIHQRLVTHKQAFERCSYMLPGFKAQVENSTCAEPAAVKSESTAVTISPDRADVTKDTTKEGNDDTNVSSIMFLCFVA